MTYSYTTSSTFTVTSTRYLASKVATDLRQMQLFYGRPLDYEITNYIEELVVLMLGGWLKSITYGFKRGGFWVIALEYKMFLGSIRATNDNAGRVKPGINTSGASWYNILSKSATFYNLTPFQRAQIEQSLPVKRTIGGAPQIRTNNLIGDKYYSRDSGALQRRIIY
ncbi:hypothetical protein KAU19_01585 [Candidatus Parcubacteria bacterium]|nr:hypothetical protein [Candidatus Parcubacteria bacterium]